MRLKCRQGLSWSPEMKNYNLYLCVTDYPRRNLHDMNPWRWQGCCENAKNRKSFIVAGFKLIFGDTRIHGLYWRGCILSLEKTRELMLSVTWSSSASLRRQIWRACTLKVLGSLSRTRTVTLFSANIKAHWKTDLGIAKHKHIFEFGTRSWKINYLWFTLNSDHFWSTWYA